MRDRHEPRSNSRRSTPSTTTAPVGRVVHAAQQLRERRLARAVLTDDGERSTGGDRQVEAVEHTMRTRRVVERHVIEPDLVRRHRADASTDPDASAPTGPMRSASPSTVRNRLRARAQPPVELAERAARSHRSRPGRTRTSEPMLRCPALASRASDQKNSPFADGHDDHRPARVAEAEAAVLPRTIEDLVAKRRRSR